MKVIIEHNSKQYAADLSRPLDISIPLGQAKCFYAPDLTKQPFVEGDFVGAVAQGAPVNFFNVNLNPHGNGTHTESLGHITEEQESINDCLKQYHFIAQLISVELTHLPNGDGVIGIDTLKALNIVKGTQALVIRTLPNDNLKLTMDYSNTNPPYLTTDAMHYIVDQGIQHLLLDLPSVDREVDEGKLLNHRIFWKVDGTTRGVDSRITSTITELIYVPSQILDGLYLLNIQFPPLELDAAPSRPVLYELL